MVWISAIITGVLCLIFASLFLARFSSVANMQSFSDNPDDIVVYDVGCAVAYGVTDEYWTDPEEALSLLAEIAEDCDADC